MATEKRRFSIRNLFRRTTPKPADRKVFNIGIQEKRQGLMMTTPLLYEIATQSVITRTCTTQLKNEVFRRGYEWKKDFALKCVDCGKKHDTPVEQCSECESRKLAKPSDKEYNYARNFLEGYVNKSNQLFIDVLKELEDDLNIVDDAYLILVKEYFLDNNGEIRMHRIKEIYRGDPITMAIYSDDVGERGTKGFTSLNDRTFISEDPNECHPETAETLHGLMFDEEEADLKRDIYRGEADRKQWDIYDKIRFQPIHGHAPPPPLMEAAPSRAGMMLSIAGSVFGGFADAGVFKAPSTGLKTNLGVGANDLYGTMGNIA